MTLCKTFSEGLSHSNYLRNRISNIDLFLSSSLALTPAVFTFPGEPCLASHFKVVVPDHEV